MLKLTGNYLVLRTGQQCRRAGRGSQVDGARLHLFIPLCRSVYAPHGQHARALRGQSSHANSTPKRHVPPSPSARLARKGRPSDRSTLFTLVAGSDPSKPRSSTCGASNRTLTAMSARCRFGDCVRATSKSPPADLTGAVEGQSFGMSRKFPMTIQRTWTWLLRPARPQCSVEGHTRLRQALGARLGTPKYRCASYTAQNHLSAIEAYCPSRRPGTPRLADPTGVFRCSATAADKKYRKHNLWAATAYSTQAPSAFCLCGWTGTRPMGISCARLLSRIRDTGSM